MENKDNKYRVAFYTLTGMIIGATAISCIFLFGNNTKKETSSIKSIAREEVKAKGNNDTEEKVSNENIYLEDNQKEEVVKTTKNNITSNKTNNVKTTDSKVIDYLKEKEQKIKESVTKENAKALFIEIVDFLFYDGEINGHTFNELTEKGKADISEICSKIELAIEEKHPGAIEETKTKYSEKKKEIIEKYNKAITKYCLENTKECIEYKEKYNSMKESFSKFSEKVKEFKEKSKEKLDNWYQEFKEKNN